MDPDENWREATSLARELAEADEQELLGRGDDAQRLAELVVALDEWVSRGGFPPRVFAPKKAV